MLLYGSNGQVSTRRIVNSSRQILYLLKGEYGDVTGRRNDNATTD
jgi:hypothetical protein